MGWITKLSKQAFVVSVAVVTPDGQKAGCFFFEQECAGGILLCMLLFSLLG